MSACRIENEILKSPCEGLIALEDLGALEIRFLVPIKGQSVGCSPIASFLLLKRKAIVFYCPSCGAHVGDSEIVEKTEPDAALSVTRKQLIVRHLRSM